MDKAIEDYFLFAYKNLARVRIHLAPIVEHAKNSRHKRCLIRAIDAIDDTFDAIEDAINEDCAKSQKHRKNCAFDAIDDALDAINDVVNVLKKNKPLLTLGD